jgi:hypothetical protein
MPLLSPPPWMPAKIISHDRDLYLHNGYPAPMNLWELKKMNFKDITHENIVGFVICLKACNEHLPPASAYNPEYLTQWSVSAHDNTGHGELIKIHFRPVKETTFSIDLRLRICISMST